MSFGEQVVLAVAVFWIVSGAVVFASVLLAGEVDE